jgi:hypothetical protein
MKRFTLAIAVMFMIAVSANGAAVITSTGSATTDLAGFTTWTLSVESPNAIVGIDASFTGAMNHVNPCSWGNCLVTVFNNYNDPIGQSGGHVSQDSQFMFAEPTAIPAIGAEESATSLKAAVTGGEGSSLGLGSSFDFAQIVIADGGAVAYNIQIDDGTGSASAFSGADLTQLAIPEPAALALMSIALVGLGFFRRSK